MNNHPLNLTVRFLLELIAVTIYGMWGWHQDGVMKYFLVILAPVAAMSIWAVFRVPNDPGKAPVAVNGKVRLIIESLFFGLAVAILFSLQHQKLAWILMIIILIHYAVSYDRTIRFLRS